MRNTGFSATVSARALIVLYGTVGVFDQPGTSPQRMNRNCRS